MHRDDTHVQELIELIGILETETDIEEVVITVTEAMHMGSSRGKRVLDLLFGGTPPHRIAAELRVQLEQQLSDTTSTTAAFDEPPEEPAAASRTRGYLTVPTEEQESDSLPQLARRQPPAFDGIAAGDAQDFSSRRPSRLSWQRGRGSSGYAALGSESSEDVGLEDTRAETIRVRLGRMARPRGTNLPGPFEWHPTIVWALASLLGVLLLSGFIVCSMDLLPPLTHGIPMDRLWFKLTPTATSSPGLHWVGLFHRFIKVPSTMQTLAFGVEARPHIAQAAEPSQHVWSAPSLEVRSKDGLPLRIVASVQWRYTAAELPELLRTLPGGHISPQEYLTPGVAMFRSITVASLARHATRYRMADWLTRKEAISSAALAPLRLALAPFVEVAQLQLLEVHLPPQVEQALLHTAVAKLSKTRGERYREAMAIAFMALQMAARYQYTQTINQAIGHARQEEQRGLTSAAVVAREVSTEMGAFTNVTDKTSITPRELLQYLYFDHYLGGKNSNREVPIDTLFTGAALGKRRRRW